MGVSETLTTNNLDIDPNSLQGVCIIETETSKRFYFTPFSQIEVDLIADARKAREKLAPNASKYSTLGRIYYSRGAIIPWGPGLQNYKQAIQTIHESLKNTESFMSQNHRLLHHPFHGLELGIIGEIRDLLDRFPKPA